MRSGRVRSSRWKLDGQRHERQRTASAHSATPARQRRRRDPRITVKRCSDCYDANQQASVNDNAAIPLYSPRPTHSLRPSSRGGSGGSGVMRHLSSVVALTGGGRVAGRSRGGRVACCGGGAYDDRVHDRAHARRFNAKGPLRGTRGIHGPHMHEGTGASVNHDARRTPKLWLVVDSCCGFENILRDARVFGQVSQWPSARLTC